MDYLKPLELNSLNLLLKQSINYFRENFIIFFKASIIIYLPLLVLTFLQIIIYLLKSLSSSLILSIFSTLLNLATPIINLAIEPTIYLVLTIVFLQIIRKEKTDLKTVKIIFINKLNNFIKTAIIFFLFFITIQQMVQVLLLIPLSFTTIKESVDLETLLFSINILEKLNSINLQQIISNLYPTTYYLTELISMVIAIIFTRKYYFYIPIIVVENLSQKLPLNNSKVLFSEVENIAKRFFFLAMLIPYLVNLINTLIFTKMLGLSGNLEDILLNLSASKQFSLFISAGFNIFIYPILVIAGVLLYLKARQALGEGEEKIFSQD